MGVQDVVARLNKSKSATTVATTPIVPKRKITSKATAAVVETKQFLPSPSPSPTGLNNKSIANMLQKFGQPPTYPSRPITTPTSSPPESPVISLKRHPTPTVIKKVAQQKNQFDITASEIEDLFQSLLEQNKAAEEYIAKLKVDVEKYSSDATKVRDYEIRVEYLALKLEQVSEERDFFEKELNELQSSHHKKNHHQNTMDSPMSPTYTYQHDIVIEDEKILQNQNNDAYMEDILNVYEEISDHSMTGDEMQLFDQQSQSQQECDKGIQMTIVKYVTDLETQKLETKALKQVVKKQDELITKLETKIRNESSDELLKEQVQVQRIELDNKRELLSQLLNEREDLLRRVTRRRSSIDLIQNDVRPSSYSSVSSSGRGTPPLTAPPKQPLPPLPLK